MPEHRLPVRELKECSVTPTTTLIEELEKEFPARKGIYREGTVNDALRMLGVTGKQVTLRNPLRDALASARYHVLAATVLVRCMVRATMGSTIR